MTDPEEHDDLARDLEREANRLEHESESVADDISRTRKDWEAKQHDQSVPGAVVPEDEDKNDEQS